MNNVDLEMLLNTLLYSSSVHRFSKCKIYHLLQYTFCLYCLHATAHSGLMSSHSASQGWSFIPNRAPIFSPPSLCRQAAVEVRQDHGGRQRHCCSATQRGSHTSRRHGNSRSPPRVSRSFPCCLKPETPLQFVLWRIMISHAV